MSTITRELENALYELEKEFQSLYTKEDFNRQLVRLHMAGMTSARPSALSRLYSMLRQAWIPFERGREDAYYEELVKNAALPGFAELDEKIMQSLYEKFLTYPKPEDYMKRIVDRLEDPKDKWSEDSLRLRILKRFIVYGDYLSAAGKNGKKVIQAYVKKKKGIKKEPSVQEVIEGLDDGVFKELKTATKAQKKPDGKFGLLKTADDLAAGKFREGGATKKDLYLFAMVYNMTYYTGRPDETIDYERDLEKNLFSDYYTNNLMRFVTEAYKENKLSEFERDPSGQGVNYKNFAEMVYLYYIRKDMEPVEKIRRSSGMIQELISAAYQKGGPDGKEKEGTQVYKQQVVRGKDEPAGEEILEKPEREFYQYLLANYHCDTYDAGQKGKISEMKVEAGQETAFRKYKELLAGIRACGEKLENCNYGLWFTDPGILEKYGQTGDASYDDFIEFLLALNRYLGSTSKTKALFVDSAEKITRTSLLVAYYYYYNAWHMENLSERQKSFKEVFMEFRHGLDEILAESGYQPVSGKSIIDVIVIFSAYAYINGY